MSRLRARLNRLDRKAPPHMGQRWEAAMYRAAAQLTQEQGYFITDAIDAGLCELDVYAAMRPLMRMAAPEHATWLDFLDSLGEPPTFCAPREDWVRYGMTPPPKPPPGLAQRLLRESDHESELLARMARLYCALELLMAEEWPKLQSRSPKA